MSEFYIFAETKCQCCRRRLRDAALACGKAKGIIIRKIAVKESKIMKKSLTLVLGAALVVSSCTSYTGAGAYMGTSLGSILGSAIGGIAGGPRGSDIGTIVGMAGGAVVGSAIGAAVDNSENARQYDDARQSSHRSTQTNRHRNNIQRYEAR